MQPAREKVCDKCRNSVFDLYICVVCRSTTCGACNIEAHSKPSTKSHKRILRRLNSFDYKYAHELPLTYFTPEFYRSQSFSKDNFVQRVLESAHRVLIFNTQNGNPMVPLNELSHLVANEVGVPPGRVAQALEGDLRVPTIHKTLRTFGENSSQLYYSLCFANVSIESIVWILRSIRNDQMQPSESLVFSRFKEYFALKVVMKDWKRLIESLLKSRDLLAAFNLHRDILEEIDIREIDDGNFLILLRDTHWTYEDLSDVRDTDEDYLSFLNYLDGFFEKSQDELDAKEAELKKLLSPPDGQKKRTTNLVLDPGHKKAVQSESIIKAIPGGKYGSAQFLRNCGPLILRKSSIGRIYALLKHALNTQVISHLKTHIIKNDQKSAPLNVNRDKEIQELQNNVLELLREQDKETVTLAQLPLLLQKKYGIFYNFQELGFIKLKNFLTTLEDKIELTRSSNNHIKVSLRRKEPLHSPGVRSHPHKLSSPPAKDSADAKKRTDSWESATQPLPHSQKGMLAPTKPLPKLYLKDELNRGGFDEVLSPRPFVLNPQFVDGSFLNMSESKRVSQKKLSHTHSHDSGHQLNTSTAKPQDDTVLSASEFCKQFELVKNFILEKIKLCRFGLEMKKLELELSQFLGNPFKPRVFNSESLHQFLIENFSAELDIGLKKTVKSKVKKTATNPEYLIYPKSGVATKIGSHNDSFESMNRSGNSGGAICFFDNHYNSDTSQGNARRQLQDNSATESSQNKPPAPFPAKHSSNWSNKADDDNLDVIFRDEDNQFFCTKNDTLEEPRVKDIEIPEDIKTEESIQKARRFINYIYD